jgi:uncharacterized protein YndB with AHSA1/START domain
MYTVVAQRQIPMPVEKVWDYLTKPELLAKWFADTSHFMPDGPVRMDFGDGDFFSGKVVEWDPGIILGLRWQFVGQGPEYEVRYSMLGRKQGTELSVQDRGAITRAEAECLRVGWSEFLLRLDKAIVKNVSTRFNWRKALTFTSSVEAAKREALAAALNDPSWYQTSLAGVHARIHESPEDEINSTLTHEAWGPLETRARVRLRKIRGVDYALVAHEGWPQLPSKLAEEERRRFVTVWLGALAEFSVKFQLGENTATFSPRYVSP